MRKEEEKSANVFLALTCDDDGDDDDFNLQTMNDVDDHYVAESCWRRRDIAKIAQEFS